MWYYRGQKFDNHPSAFEYRWNERVKFCGHCGPFMGYESKLDDNDYTEYGPYYCKNEDCSAFNFYQRPLTWDELTERFTKELTESEK